MTNLKNKLSASVRQAQGIQSDSVEIKQSVKRAANPAPIQASPPPQKSTPGRKTVVRPVETGTALFPDRVWPD
ncbi:hypothetical protein [Polaromonas sp.]|uniref:hypothetical protein n=1 Tax=Polaromonas sp. TaxID=1869339 RepID=UPI002487B1D8|nr:hypothetical protein [Polaromonas sp.]MDI1339959.1 hypothetical protein [Polaromonas sp.]